MDKYELRRQRLQNLVDQAGGPSQFAKKFSRINADKPIDETYVSQILNLHRKFGEKAARNMENRAGLPSEYFDREEEQATNVIHEKEQEYVANLELRTRHLKPLTQKVVEMMESANEETRGAIYGAALMIVNTAKQSHQTKTPKVS